jgi:hypothetical protein
MERLVKNDTIAEAKIALLRASRTVMQKANATRDVILRGRLMSVAREMASLYVDLNGKADFSGDDTPCFIRVLDREIAGAVALFPDRHGSIRRGLVSLDFTPCWTAELIFGLVARDLIQDAIYQTNSRTALDLHLRRDRAMLRFWIHGAGPCGEQELMSRIERPQRFQSLVRSVSGRLESVPNGLLLKIPVESCTPI